MKELCLNGKGIVIGQGSLAYLKEVDYRKCMLITGGASMRETGVVGQIQELMGGANRELYVYSGIGKNPTTKEILAGLGAMQHEQPDLVLAVGGGSAIDAAKAMALFYEFPKLNFSNVVSVSLPQKREKVRFIAIPSTSGTGTEVTNVTVYTDTEKNIKVALRTKALRPDIAILDANIAMTMPRNIAAETGMDALTHAIEAYTNPGLDDFIEVIARGAIEGLIKWLPSSCNEPTLEAREKVHYYQCMAGIAFANVGLGMVHGISHSFGAMYNMAHGLANAVILPYVMEYNNRDTSVLQKFNRLSTYIGDDIIQQVWKLQKILGITSCFKDTGLLEENFMRDFAVLVEHAMMGATAVNPVKMSVPEMEKMVRIVYYGSAL
jgi:alcohol dehydrogenase class IV